MYAQRTTYRIVSTCTLLHLPEDGCDLMLHVVMGNVESQYSCISFTIHVHVGVSLQR